MQGHCPRCGRILTAKDLAREESQGMEAERRALGLEGVKFRYYVCSACHQAEILVRVLRLPGEPGERFERRREELEQAVQQVPSRDVEVILVAG